MRETLTRVREGLAAWAAGFDPTVVSAGDCAAIVADLARIENIAAAKARAAARVADTGAWRGRGDKTAAEWLAHATGTTTTQAKGLLETGQRLAGLDVTAAAAARGDLSPAQTAAVADAATADPGVEARLLDVAQRESLGGLRETCQRAKAAADPDPDATWRRLHRQRSARTYTDGEGAWHLHLRTTADAGATIASVLDELTDDIFKVAYADGRRKTRDAYAADALVEMARRARHRQEATSRRSERFLVLVRADLDALVHGRVDGEEICETDGVGPVPVTSLRDLLGDAIIKLILTRGVDVANITHLGRGPTVAQKLALLWSQPKCEVQGCTRRARLQTDHRTPWATNQVTHIDNLDHLCHHHHQLKTTNHWALVTGTGTRPMVPPDHPHHPSQHRQPGAA